MWFRVGVDLVVAVHLLFIGFVVFGAFLAWRWPRIIWVQLPAMVYGALIEFIGFTCPLTPLENYLRRRAGEGGYRGGFIGHYLVSVIYPPGLTRGVQVGLGVAVLVIAVIGYAGYLRRHAPGLLGRMGRVGRVAAGRSRPGAGSRPADRARAGRPG